MGSFIYLLLVVVLAVMIFKNIKLAKRAKHTKKYIACSDGIFNDEDCALSRIDDYIETDDSVEFQNKARVLKIYQELRQGMSPRETISQIDLHETIYTKEKFDVQKFEFNSDTYFWLILDLVKLFKSQYNYEVDNLKAVLDKYHEDIKTDIAVELFYQIYNNLKDEENKDVTFFKNLVAGEYVGYTYDKRLIGFYKKVASSMLAYLNEELSEEDLDDLKVFSDMKAGKLIMKDLDIFEKYKKDDGLDDKEENDILESINNEHEEVKEDIEDIKEENKEDEDNA